MELLSDEWVKALVKVSEAAADASDRSATIELAIGKTRQAVLSMVDGRVVGKGRADDVEVSIPFTEEQLHSILTGDESLAQAYIRGDVKPVGSTGAFIAFVELAESGALTQLA